MSLCAGGKPFFEIVAIPKVANCESVVLGGVSSTAS